MDVTLKLKKNFTIIATDEKNLETSFDASYEHGGDGNASSPMVILLEAMAACSFIDILMILKKMRKTINNLQVNVNGFRAEEHPKVFKKVHLHYILNSPDTKINDLERAIELSHTKYCGASAMFQKSGCLVSWGFEIIN